MNQRQKRLVVAALAHHIAAEHNRMIIFAVQQGFPLAQIVAQPGSVQIADVQDGKAFEGLVQPHDMNLLRFQRQLLVHAPVGQPDGGDHCGKQHENGQPRPQMRTLLPLRCEQILVFAPCQKNHPHTL